MGVSHELLEFVARQRCACMISCIKNSCCWMVNKFRPVAHFTKMF